MKVLVVGGGAAGLMAAGAALRQGHEVTVLEHMEKPAQKILVTGKGRCNVTNDCTAEEFLHHVRTNPRFLFSSLGAFPPAKTMELFESLGVELKVERGRRVFPVSDKAEEIRQALLRYADGADIVHDGAKKLLLEPLAQPEEAPAAPEDPRHPKKKKPGPAYRCVGVRGTSGREYKADAVLVATGGLSYPTTGSTGDGYKLAQQAGHTLVEPVPSLVSLVSHDADCKKMMGLALKNVTLTLHEDGKAIFEEQGEMLFTHFGISGPLTLSASSHLGDMKKHKYEAFIDLKPALSEEQLYDRITRDFALLANHAAQGALVKLLPSSMQPVMVARWGIDPATRANQITREQKRELVQLMKHWRVSIDARGDLAHAVITSGGVSVREVDPKTMQSKKALGLYFAGEVLDVDAYTGGYNLQIAFCTAQSFANHLELTSQSASQTAPSLGQQRLPPAVERRQPGWRGLSGWKFQIHREGDIKMISVAIDGPAGAGKSTLARRLAADFGYIYVDTGAMFRTIGLYALRAGKEPKDNEAVDALLPNITLEFAFIEGEQHIYLNGEDVSTAIRTEEVGMAASAVGANPAVRAFLLEMQRDMAKTQNILMDGRDIGTVVLPNATVKIFLTASPEARATRRWKEYQQKGIDTPYEDVLADVKQRDYQDTHRAAAPLKQADDAVLLDTSELNFEQSFEAMKKIITEKVR